ncbi:MAG: glycogen debranching enzyme GlgX [Anaerolineaceae bacterium]|nr:MAG: glycogen debranching enzyme GlgX [Anaerolineaceae bacterium]
MHSRIDNEPTHSYAGYPLRIGQPLPYGATLTNNGVNFSIFSRHADACALVLYHVGEAQPLVEIPFPDEFRIGNVFTMQIFGLDYERIEYGFRFDGPYKPRQGLRFDHTKVLLDPYAKLISGRDVWGEPPQGYDDYPHRARIVPTDYDWRTDRPPHIPIEDLVIYEMHVRGFTQHPSSDTRYPGSFAAIREKIPYFKELGINCIELMPIFEFDEFEYSGRSNPITDEPLKNYWGYSSVGFFAPKAGFAATGGLGMQSDELKALVGDLHRNGMEIILDVVFNHTAEGNENGRTISFRGIDNKTYYMLTPDGYYLNFSGTGNTMNCNNPIVRGMVLDCLRHWVAEYHIDGFRFDLASILGRDQNGHPLANPPLIELLAYDPVLANVKLIAEAWDAGGLYQVGSFPDYGRWAEWNGRYRDTIRQWLKGTRGIVWDVAQCLQGSPDLYAGRGASASINFITAHDGFTLRDLFTYDHKHNYANGEDNRDGTDANYSWNCGIEGHTNDPIVNDLRRRLIKNAIALLMVSRGVPMILMGDEMGRTQNGNNNTYCHDTEWNWLNWDLLQENPDIFNFFKQCIAFRHAHPVLRSKDHFLNRDAVGSGYADITWHGTSAWQAEWDDHILTLAFMLDGSHARDGSDDMIYVGMNMHWTPHRFDLPDLPRDRYWHVFANTSPDIQVEIVTPGEEPRIINKDHIWIGARSVIILVGR